MNDLELTIRTQAELGIIHWDREDYVKAEAAFAKAVELARNVGPSQVGGDAQAAGDAYYWLGRTTEDEATATASLDTAEDLYARILDSPRQARVYRQRAERLLTHGVTAEHGERALAELDRADELLRGLEAPYTRVLVLFSRSLALQPLGRYREALVCVNDLERIVKSFGGSYFEPFRLERRAQLQVLLGQQAEAAETFRRLGEEYQRLGQSRRQAHALVSEANALIQSKDFKSSAKRANRCLAEAEFLYRQLRDPSYEAVAQANRSHLHYRLGEYKLALELGEQSLSELADDWRRDPEVGFVCLAILVEAMARQGRPDAGRLVVEAWSRYQSLSAKVRAENSEVCWHVDELRTLTGDRLLPPATLPAELARGEAGAAAGAGAT